MTRRISRGAPTVLTDQDRKRLIAGVESNPAQRADIETTLGVSWGALSEAQKIGAIQRKEEVGYGLNSLNMAIRAEREFARLAADIRGEVDLVDRVALLEEQVRSQKETIARLEAENKALKVEKVAEKAAAAMVVHAEPSR